MLLFVVFLPKYTACIDLLVEQGFLFRGTCIRQTIADAGYKKLQYMYPAPQLIINLFQWCVHLKNLNTWELS